MNKFSWYEAKSVEDAINQVNSTLSEQLYESTSDAAVFKSGGIDIFDWVKEVVLEEENNISEKDLDLIQIVDTADEAVNKINEFYSKYLLTPNF